MNIYTSLFLKADNYNTYENLDTFTLILLVNFFNCLLNQKLLFVDELNA